MSDVPRLSPSIAHDIVMECPLVAWLHHSKLGATRKAPKPAMESGTLQHALVLGRGMEQVEVVVGFNDFKKKAAQELRDAARAAGKVPIVEKKFAAEKLVSDRIAEGIARHGYDLSAGTAEKKLEWEEPGLLGPIACSGQPDWVSNDGRLILDLKIVEGSAHPNACAAALARTAGCIQGRAYRNAVSIRMGTPIQEIDAIFLFCQSTEPYAVTPIRFGMSMHELGTMRWDRAKRVWQSCLAAGPEREHWPAYAEGVVEVDAPSWAIHNEIYQEALSDDD